jgi:hypothetical protein
MAMLISASGTRLGIGALFCGGVPKTVARNAAESARPVAGPGAAGGAMNGVAGFLSCAMAAADSIEANANGIRRLKRTRETPYPMVSALFFANDYSTSIRFGEFDNMKARSVPLLPAVIIAGICFSAATAIADVTIERKTTLDVASMIRTHGSSTTNITTDKKREDTESHCEGMMSMVCGNVRGGQIVRLDRGLTWHLQPDKKTYREDVFATPEALAEMRARTQARLDKMRACPVSQRQQPIDKSKCEMSPPKIDVHKTGDKMSIAGHDAERTQATLTQTCTVKDSGDVCDTVIALDVWLTQENLPGTGERRAFEQAYAKKLGLVDEQGALRGDFAKFLAPYQSQIKELTDKSSDFKGEPLKTSLRVLMGGQQCGATNKMRANGSPGADASAAGGASPMTSGNPMANVAQAGKALGSSVSNMMGGLFHKKKADDSAAPAGAATTPDSTGSAAGAAGAAPNAAAPVAAAASDPYAQYVQMATFSSETVSISSGAVPPERFEIPADWNRDVPKAAAKVDDDFTCPKTGG